MKIFYIFKRMISKNFLEALFPRKEPIFGGGKGWKKIYNLVMAYKLWNFWEKGNGWERLRNLSFETLNGSLRWGTQKKPTRLSFSPGENFLKNRGMKEFLNFYQVKRKIPKKVTRFFPPKSPFFFSGFFLPGLESNRRGFLQQN